MNKRIAKKVWRGQDSGRYSDAQIKRALTRLFPPGLLRVRTRRFRIIEDESLDNVVINPEDEALFREAFP